EDAKKESAPQPTAEGLLPGSGTPSAVPDQPNQDAFTAEQLLDRMAKAYANCKSYRDSGVVKTVFIQVDEGKRTVNKPFTTGFAPPRGGRQWAVDKSDRSEEDRGRQAGSGRLFPRSGQADRQSDDPLDRQEDISRPEDRHPEQVRHVSHRGDDDLRPRAGRR